MSSWDYFINFMFKFSFSFYTADLRWNRFPFKRTNNKDPLILFDGLRENFLLSGTSLPRPFVPCCRIYCKLCIRIWIISRNYGFQFFVLYIFYSNDFRCCKRKKQCTEHKPKTSARNLLPSCKFNRKWLHVSDINPQVLHTHKIPCAHACFLHTHTHTQCGGLDRLHNSQVVCRRRSGFVEMFCHPLLSV